MSATTKSYQIQSVQTSQILVEHPSGGPRVKTTLDRGIHPFKIVPSPSSSGTTTCVIQGSDGLYIRPGPREHHIVWSKESYKWQVAPIGKNYQIYPADGEDLYWFQSATTVPFVGLAPGRDLVEKQPIFTLSPL